jgi:pilus assembly protein CpaB
MAAFIVSVILTCGLLFGLMPYIEKTMTERKPVLFAVSEIQQGDVITAQNTEMRTIGTYNIPKTVITEGEQAIGKYAAYDLLPGDYITSAKVQNDESDDFKSFNTLDGTQVAMSVAIEHFSDGLSGKLTKGDVVSFLSVDSQGKNAKIMPELKYVYVLAVTSSEGIDKEDGDIVRDANATSASNLPSTITVLVSDAQAELLGKAEETGRLWALLAYRGGKTTAQKFLDEQNAYNSSAAAQREEEKAAGEDDAEVS